MSNLAETNYDDLEEILKKHHQGFHMGEFLPTKEADPLKIDLENYFSADRYVERAVLGVDIYRYSKYPETQQLLIPIIFELLYNNSMNLCKKCEMFLFQNIKLEDFPNSFISIGDGGFQILPTPLHAFLYACYFEEVVRAFNSYSILAGLRHIVGPLSLRYALTLGKVFHFKNNFFGEAIINNARILSRDTLNRFLLDNNAHDWFLHKVGGFETLRLVDLETLSQLQDFKEYDKALIAKTNIIIKSDKSKKPSDIDFLSIQKIGLVEPKGTSLDVYSLYAQIGAIVTSKEDPHNEKKLVVAIGNTNSSGI